MSYIRCLYLPQTQLIIYANNAKEQYSENLSRVLFFNSFVAITIPFVVAHQFAELGEAYPTISCSTHWSSWSIIINRSHLCATKNATITLHATMLKLSVLQPHPFQQNRFTLTICTLRFARHSMNNSAHHAVV